MKSLKKKIMYGALGLIGLIIIVFIANQGLHFIRRVQDNRERDIIIGHVMSIKESLRAESYAKGRILTPEEAKNIIQSSRYTNPHTNKHYVYVGKAVGDLKEGEIAYGVGACGITSTKPYVGYNILLKRVGESGGSCEPL